MLNRNQKLLTKLVFRNKNMFEMYFRKNMILNLDFCQKIKLYKIKLKYEWFFF